MIIFRFIVAQERKISAEIQENITVKFVSTTPVLATF